MMIINKRFLKHVSTATQFGAVIALAGFTACTAKHASSPRQGIDPQPEVSAPSDVRDSFGSAKAASALPTDLSPGNQDQVIIQKTALDFTKPVPLGVRFSKLGGKPHGRWVWFYKTGVRMGSGSFARGKKAGTWISYDKKGKVAKVTNFPKG